jgi:hypothetical protein
MSDTARGLIIGVAVGFLTGLMIGAIVGGLVREYAPPGPVASLIVENAQLWGVIIGIIIGVVGSYRMLQNLERQREK